MDENGRRLPIPRPMQHGRPKQVVKITDVFSDEMVELNLAIRSPGGIKILAIFVAISKMGSLIANGSIKPNIEIFSRSNEVTEFCFVLHFGEQLQKRYFTG